MACGKHGHYMEVVAYHMYHLKNRTEVIPWREKIPEILTKHKLFSKGVWKTI